MNLALLLPAGLAALAALLLPLLVHLARRSERRPTPFAALAFLTVRARPRRHVRFDEWLLLALRLLLVAALALLLARPALLGEAAATPWTLVVPGVDPAQVLRESDSDRSRSSIASAGHGDDGAVERRWLAPGFPPLSTSPPAGRVPVSSLLRELDATLPAGSMLTVHVPPLLAGVDAERPRLSRAVRWVVASPGAVRGDNPAAAAGAGATPPMPVLVVRHAADRAPALRYLRASVAAWQAMDADGAGSVPVADDGVAGTADGSAAADAADAIDVAPLGTPLPADVALLAWLAPGPLPAAVRDRATRGAVVLVDADATWPGRDAADGTDAWRTATGELLLREHALGRGRLLQWMRPLRPDAMPALLDPDFPAHLRAALSPAGPAPAMADAATHAPQAGAPSWTLAPRELAPWLLWLVAGLFALERWCATRPRREAAT